MLVLFLTVLISYIFSIFFGYVIHWSLHQSWMGLFYKAHLSHHLEKYPPNDYKSDVYRHAGKNSTPVYFIIIASPLLIIPIILSIIGIIPWHLVLIFIGIQGLMGLLHDRIHDSFHINNHWLNKIPLINKLYSQWAELHYLHHVDMSSNFGIFIFHFDHMFKTYRKK